MVTGFSEAEHAALRATFNQFDSDGSNTIDLQELSEVMAHIGVRMEAAQLAELVQQANVNANGELEFDAFAQLLLIWKEAAKMKAFDGGVNTSAHARLATALATRLVVTDSWPRCCFDALVALTAVGFYIVVLLDDAHSSSDSIPTAMLAFEVAATVIFVADCVMGIVTWRGTDKLGTDVKAYARSWLVPDVLAAMPWGLMVAGPFGVAARHLRLLKIAKLPTMWESSGRMPVTAAYISFHFKVLPITLLAVMFGIMVHGFTIGFMLVKQFNGDDPLVVDGQYPYDVALYFVIYTLCTIGYGNVAINAPNEKLYSCLVLWGTILCNGYIVGKLVSIMQSADVQQDRVGKLRQTLSVLQHFDLPHALQDEVLQFQDHLLGHALGSSYASTLSGLPTEMHANINIVVKLRLLTSARLFSELHDVVKVALAQKLNNVVAVPEQYLLGVADDVRAMHFVSHGLVDVVSRTGLRVRTLGAGQYFGAGMLIGGVTSTVSVKALGYCEMWSLARSDLVSLSQRFPPLRRVMADCEHKYDEFECVALSSPRADDGTTRQSTVNVLEDETMSFQCSTEADGELEEAHRRVVHKNEQLRQVLQRLNAAQRRLRELCSHE